LEQRKSYGNRQSKRNQELLENALEVSKPRELDKIWECKEIEQIIQQVDKTRLANTERLLQRRPRTVQSTLKN
jgi:hypothetical protein